MNHTATFIPARELSRELARLTEPRLRELLPGVPFALAHIGAGSDVLGFDTARSMDHDWGPRLTIVVPEESFDDAVALTASQLERLLPPTVRGYPTRFSQHEDGTLAADPEGSLHRLEVTSVTRLLGSHLHIDDISELRPDVWLSTPMQSLLEFTAGEVFTDDSGELTQVRMQLSFYPTDIWRYQLAALWMRVSQLNPFVGRTGEVADDAGSAVITAAIARDLMRIALLQSRQYAPYAKWLGSACARAEVGTAILPLLGSALSASNWRSREAGINAAGIQLIQQLNALGIIDEIPVRTEQFHSRPFTILPAERIAEALQASLAGTEIEHLAPFVGGIDVVTDSTDALKNPLFRTSFRSMWVSR